MNFRALPAIDHLARDDDLGYIVHRRNLEHQVQHELFENRSESPSAGFALHRSNGYLVNGAFGEFKLNVFEGEYLLVLLREGVHRLGANSDEGFLAQFVKHGDDRQTAPKFRDTAL